MKAKRSYKGVISGLILLAMVTAFLVIFAIQIGDISLTFNVVLSADGFELFLALLCLAGYIIIWPIGMVIFNNLKSAKATSTESYLIGASQHFFNGITPYQTGGQPFQIYSYSRLGESAGTSTGIVLVNYITLLVASNLFVAYSLIFSGTLFGSFYEIGWLWVPIVGLCMNFLALIAFIALASGKTVKNLLIKLITVLCRIKLLNKFLSGYTKGIDDYCTAAQGAARDIFANLPVFSIVVLTKFIGLALYYSIPFFIIRALGINMGADSFLFCMLATAFCINCTAFVPTPGSAGGIELVFALIFALYIPSPLVAAAVILWRGITYYLLILISFLQHLWLELLLSRKKRKKATLHNQQKSRFLKHG